MIQLSLILHSKPVFKSIPSFIENKTPPTISYSYTKTIAGKIFNFKQTINDLDFEVHVGTQNLSCSCHDSLFRCDPVGHVVTGNLRIVENRKLRKLLSKGPSYREQIISNGKPTLRFLKKLLENSN